MKIKDFFNQTSIWVLKNKKRQKSKKISQKQEDTALQQALEPGRSMVEMLGVLAIIGVLSITGIIGYRYAMNKYVANKIANEMNLVDTQIAVALLKSHAEEFEVSVGSPYDDERLVSAEYPFYFGCGTDPEVVGPCAADEISYYEMLENVPKQMCQTLVQMTQHLPYLIEQKVNGTEDYTGVSCQDENNQIVLLFEVDEYNAGDFETSNYPETGTVWETTPFICESNADCANWWGSYQPVCDLSSNQCVGCLNDTDCSPFTYAPACFIPGSEERGYCVQCTNDSHCGSQADKKACRADTHWCVQCTDNTHCASVAGMPVCKTNTYKCVQCLTNSDCTDTEYPFCNTSKNTCGECQTHADCATKYDDLPYCIQGTCKPCKDNYAMKPDTKTVGGLTYHEFCFGNNWVDWSVSNSNGCHLFGTGWGADSFCRAQGGLPSIYDLLLISGNPLRYKEGDEVKVCYGSTCYTYTGPFPTTDAYKNKYKEMCPGIDTSGRVRVFTSTIVGWSHVEVNLVSGTLGMTEDGSGNYWLTVACKDYLNRVSY